MICEKMVKDGKALLASSFVNNLKYFWSNIQDQDRYIQSFVKDFATSVAFQDLVTNKILTIFIKLFNSFMKEASII